MSIAETMPSVTAAAVTTMTPAEVRAALTHDESWRAARREGVGASELGELMAGDWHALWQRKTGRADGDDLSSVLPVQMGSWTEPLNRMWFAEQTGIAVEIAHGPTWDRGAPLFANLDGLANGCPWEGKHVHGNSKAETIIERYWWQLQGQMLCADAPMAYLSVFFGNADWRYWEIAADTDAQARIADAVRTFWSYVQRDEAPPSVVGDPPPKIAFDDMRECDMTGSNEWGAYAASWLDSRDAAKEFRDAEKALKELVEADVKRAYGHGIEIKRSSNGALRIGEQK